MKKIAQKIISLIGNILTPAERLVAVDVGSRYVKIAEFRVKKDQIEIICLDSMVIPYGSSNGVVTPEKVNQTLEKLLQKNNIKSSGIISLLPREFATVKQFELPSTEKQQLKQMIQFEAEKYLPFSIDRAIIDFDFRVINDDISEDSTSEETKEEDSEAPVDLPTVSKSLISMAGVRKAVIPKFLELLILKGSRQRKIDLSSFALYNAFYFNCLQNIDQENLADGENEHLIINIGARRTECILISGKHSDLNFSRSVNYAGDILTEYIAEKEEISFEEAESRKCLNWQTTVLNDPAEFEAAFAPLLQELQKTLRYIKKSLDGDLPNQIWLCGGSANVPVLADYLSEKLGVEVRQFDPLAQFKSKMDPAARSSFGLVVGGALRNIGKSIINIDLLPVDITKLQLQALRQKRLIQLAIVLLMLAVVFIGYTGIKVVFSNNHLKSINQRIAMIQPKVIKVNLFEKRNEQLRLIVGEMEELTDLKTSWTKVMQSISECMDSNVWIGRLDVGKDNKLELDVFSSGIEYLDFVNKLKERLRFENVYAKSSQTITSRVGSRREVQNVKVTCDVLPDFKYNQKLQLLVTEAYKTAADTQNVNTNKIDMGATSVAPDDMTKTNLHSKKTLVSVPDKSPSLTNASIKEVKSDD